MASWLVREKLAPLVMVELLEKAIRLLRTATRRPPLLEAKQARPMLRQVLFALFARRQKKADSRLPLLGMQQGSATLRRALFALPA
jgi:hypothetical protein